MDIGAFFDLDGTLIASPSLERRFLRYLCWRHELKAPQWARWLLEFLRRALLDWLAATEGNKACLAGVRETATATWAARLSTRCLGFFPEGLLRQEWHAAQGHRLFLVSGTLAPLAHWAAQELARRRPTVLGAAPSLVVCATELAAYEGRWTGAVVGEAICGPAKAHALERLAAEHGLDLGRSYAYGNSWSDRWMLERVGHPVAVNPSPRLERLARRRGWRILWWREAACREVRVGTGESAAPQMLAETLARADLLHHARAAEKNP